MENNKGRRDELSIQMKKLTAKLKNEYYGKKAKLINEASACDNDKDEFRRAKNYKASNNNSS